MNKFNIQGNIVDITTKEIYYGEVEVYGGKIKSIHKLPTTNNNQHTTNFILPGFIDSHVHIESSLLVPSEFAKIAVTHGTIATISDPHEIVNVCGVEGVNFMIENGKTVPFKFHFGAPSCVPATTFETSGATLNSADVDLLLQNKDIFYLSEVMNYPGVLNEDEELIQKIQSAKKYNKPIDGHAPGLMGELAKKYISHGISTDHECFTKEEALSKLSYGMKILIREGSAAKNFEALIDLLNDYEDEIMFCSDDKHPDSLVLGHINQLCARAVAKGVDVFKVLKAACINPVKHYNMQVGLLQKGDYADFIVVGNLTQFNMLQTYINGILVAENGVSNIKTQKSKTINNFNCVKKSVDDFAFFKKDFEKNNFAIEALDGQLITNKIQVDISELLADTKKLISNTENDILKIVVVNRYHNSPISKGFIKNFGLKKGAIASSVAHDSHNIVAVGVDDESICNAVNLIIETKGGISAVNKNQQKILPLPVAGLMSNEDGYKIAERYTAIDTFSKKELGSTLVSPFMTLSFMALLVIPHLKLSDQGLFDGDNFSLF